MGRRERLGGKGSLPARKHRPRASESSSARCPCPWQETVLILFLRFCRRCDFLRSKSGKTPKLDWAEDWSAFSDAKPPGSYLYAAERASLSWCSIRPGPESTLPAAQTHALVYTDFMEITET